ncbi:PAS domain-containing protein [Rhizobium gallicum bv. gallicum R602sp]|uniref:PAS domain-containing protein n=2 Tax=Rhizobium TaxID=379 RepID=A0A0B4X0Y8_9HYPH|nr:PAS domain-containing protein [Rhizobium gallicum]AJD41589.1 PAS domain-containing protein [Rhizobium gallicum bv. gallicum R602sp]
MLELLQAFSSRCSQIEEAIRLGDDRRVATLDGGFELLVEVIVDHHAANLMEVYMQLQFVGYLLQQDAGDAASVSHHSTRLISLLERCFGALPRADVALPRELPLPAPKAYVTNVDNGNFLNSAILETFPDRVAVLTRDYRYLYSNPVNCAYLGRSPIDMIGRHVMEFIGEEQFVAQARAKFDACFAGQHVEYNYEQRGESRRTRCRMSPLRDLCGQVLGALVVLESADAISTIAA